MSEYPIKGNNLPFHHLFEVMGESDPEMGSSKMARVLDTTRSTVDRWRSLGLAPHTADRVAIRLGLHPAMIWPMWAEDVDLEEEGEA